MISSLTTTEWIRLFLVYTHLLASMLAIAGVLSADIGLITGKLHRKQLRNTAKRIVNLLIVLWLTGLTLVWLDTAFEPAELLIRQKLLVKLLVVSVLTTNGIVLHWISFPLLLSTRSMSLSISLLLTITGALSTMHWLLAAFVGVTRPLGKIPLEELIEGYAVLLVATVAISAACVPLVRNRVLNWRQSSSSESPCDVPQQEPEYLSIPYAKNNVIDPLYNQVCDVKSTYCIESVPWERTTNKQSSAGKGLSNRS